MSDWYDHAHYFDLLFRDETDAEVKFFKSAFKKFAKRKVRRLLEPGCGSGRLVHAMADEGYSVTGLDLNPNMLAYLDKRLADSGLSGKTVLGDMTDMKLGESFDAAFCTFNTFRHMLTQSDAIAHLRSVADHLEPGGIYVLGFHIIPLDADEDCTEKWKAKDSSVKLKASLKVVGFNRKKRREKLRIRIRATDSSGRVENVEDRFTLRLYTDRQVKKMLTKVDDVLEIAGIFDFDYDIRSPRKLNDDLTDAVFVLRRK